MSNIQLMNLSREELLDSISEIVSQHVDTLKNEFQPKEPAEWLTRQEVADILKIDLSTLHSYVNRGILKSYGMGRRVYFRRDELESALIPISKKR